MSAGRRRHKIGRARSEDNERQSRAEKRRMSALRRHCSKAIAKEGLELAFPKSELLDAFVESRLKHSVHKICSRSQRRISIVGFSFIDFPAQTMEILRAIIIADSRGEQYYLDFLDARCLDVGAYLAFSLIYRNLVSSTNILGGKMTGHVARVLQATKIAEELKIITPQVGNALIQIDPIEIVNCKHTPSERRTSLASQHGELADKFSRKVNGWLGRLGFELTEPGEASLMQMISEVLENAIIHGKPKTMDGEAWLTGFMDLRETSSGPRYACHIAVLNIGASIYESMQTCSPHIRAQIEDLVSIHRGYFRLRRRWSQDSLWTLYALQDGVTRMSDPNESKGGRGMMDLLELFATLGGGNTISEEPSMTIISGHTCVHLKGQQPERRDDGIRVLALNEGNDLHKPPESAYIQRLVRKFPGTILSMRFHLNPTFLEASANGRNNG